MESSVAVPQKLNIDLAHDPAIPLQCLYSPRLETDVQTETHTWMSGSSIHNIQVVWTTQISRKTSVNKQIVVYPCNGILFSHKSEWSIDACYNEVPWNHDAMLQKPDTKLHILFDFIYKKYPK